MVEEPIVVAPATDTMRCDILEHCPSVCKRSGVIVDPIPPASKPEIGENSEFVKVGVWKNILVRRQVRRDVTSEREVAASLQVSRLNVTGALVYKTRASMPSARMWWHRAR